MVSAAILSCLVLTAQPPSEVPLELHLQVLTPAVRRGGTVLLRVLVRNPPEAQRIWYLLPGFWPLPYTGPRDADLALRVEVRDSTGNLLQPTRAMLLVARMTTHPSAFSTHVQGSSWAKTCRSPRKRLGSRFRRPGNTLSAQPWPPKRNAGSIGGYGRGTRPARLHLIANRSSWVQLVPDQSRSTWPNERPPNKKMQRTKHCPAGASPLILVFYEPRERRARRRTNRLARTKRRVGQGSCRAYNRVSCPDSRGALRGRRRPISSSDRSWRVMPLALLEGPASLKARASTRLSRTAAGRYASH